jgi:membrane dipeptidase
MSLAHNGHSQLADSNTGERDNQWRYGGLSLLGKQVIAEMNKWGVMVDVSHPSKGAMMQTVALSKAPIIASHSAARSLANVSRNMDDEMLMALKQNGGVIQTVAFGGYVKTDSPERTRALAALRSEFGVTAAGRGAGVPAQQPAARAGRGAAAAPPSCPLDAGNAAPPGGNGAPGPVLDRLTPERRAQYDKRLAEIDAKWPPARPAVKDFVDHIDYLVKLIGVDPSFRPIDGIGGIEGGTAPPRRSTSRSNSCAAGTEGTDFQDLERQPPARVGGSRASRQGHSGGEHQIARERSVV